MATSELTATVAPDDGLPVEFLTAVAERLSGEGVAASVEYPGILTFDAGGQPRGRRGSRDCTRPTRRAAAIRCRATMSWSRWSRRERSRWAST